MERPLTRAEKRSAILDTVAFLTVIGLAICAPYILRAFWVYIN